MGKNARCSCGDEPEGRPKQQQQRGDETPSSVPILSRLAVRTRGISAAHGPPVRTRWPAFAGLGGSWLT